MPSSPATCALSFSSAVSASDWFACAPSSSSPSFMALSSTLMSLHSESFVGPRDEARVRRVRRLRLRCRRRVGEGHLQPLRAGSELQVAGEVRQLLDLGRHDGRLDGGALRAAGHRQQLEGTTRARHRAAQHLPLADQARGELRSATVLAAGAAENQRRPTIFYDRLRFPGAIRGRDLRHGLEPEYAAAAELAQPRERVLESVDLPERIELVDHEPQALAALRRVHRLEDRESHPGGDDRPQRRDLAGAIRDEEHALPLSLPGLRGPAPHREWNALILTGDVSESRNRRARDRADRIEHPAVVLLEERL